MIVALETSAPVGGVALVEGGRVLAEQVLGEASEPARDLLPTLHALLEKAGRDLGEADCVALSIGPGSFTGLRIGLATALGLCFGSSRRIAPVPTLAALARRAQAEGPIAAVLDARKRQVYAGVYGSAGEPLAPDRVCNPRPFFDSLRRWPHVTVLGPGAHVYRDEIRRALGDGARVLDLEEGWPRAACVGLLGEQLHQSGASRAPEDVELRYLRASQAETEGTGAALDTPRRNA